MGKSSKIWIINGHKKKKILSFVKFYAEIELEKVRERKMPYDFTYIWSIKNNINEQTKQKQIHKYSDKDQWLGDWVKKWRDCEVDTGIYQVVPGM